MGITKPCTQLHPAQSTSTQLVSPSTQLSAILSTLLEPKYYILGNFPKFRSKSSKLSVLTGNWHTDILEVLIPDPDLYFSNSDPEIHFWANLGRKSQGCPFHFKIGTHGISRMLILNPTLVFGISNPKFVFRQIWAQKIKAVHSLSKHSLFILI